MVRLMTFEISSYRMVQYSRLGYGNINDDKVYGKRPVNILNVFANHFLPIPKLMMFFHLMMMAIASIFVDL